MAQQTAIHGMAYAHHRIYAGYTMFVLCLSLYSVGALSLFGSFFEVG
jgi:hypothetical protein